MIKIPRNDREMYERIGDGIKRRLVVKVTLKSEMWLKRLINNDPRANRMNMNMLQYHDTTIELMHLILINESMNNYRYLGFGADRIPFTWPIQAFRRDSVKFYDKDGKEVH